MATHDYVISNASFPNTRSDINDSLSAIVSNNSNATAPSTTYAYMWWYDTNTNILKMRNADNDAWISLATFNQTNDTVDWTDSSVTADLINDASPQLAAQLDVNGNSIGDGTLELLKFIETASAVNEVTVTNAATSNAPEISATGDDTNIDLKLTPKGSGKLILDGLKFPNADGTANQVIQTDGSGNLSFATAGGGGSFTHLADLSASASSAVSIDGHFTSDYNIYKYFIYIMYSSSNDHFRIRFNRSASAITTSNYEYALDRVDSASSVSESGATGQTSGVLTWGGCNTTAGNSTTGIELTLYNPLSTTQYKGAVVHNCTYDGTSWSDNTVASRLIDSTAALSGITIITSGGENITLTGKLYGIKNS